MLRIVQNSTAAGAKSYYSTADYYTEGQELVGVWRGAGAERQAGVSAVGALDRVDRQHSQRRRLHPVIGIALAELCDIHGDRPSSPRQTRRRSG